MYAIATAFQASNGNCNPNYYQKLRQFYGPIILVLIVNPSTMSTENKDFNPQTKANAEHEDTLSSNNENVGTGPVDVADGGVPGEAKQPREHTGNMTEIGGDTETAATRIPDASAGNSNGLEGERQ